MKTPGHPGVAGLRSAEARARLAAQGPNVVPRGASRSTVAIAAAQLASPLVLVLVTAAVVAELLGERVNAVVILGIVALNAVLAFFQEYRAERTLALLRALVSRHATVRRDGAILEVPAEELVVGDVVLLEIGDMVPADLEVLDADDLTLDESTLTGESLPVARPPGARALMGTAIAGGCGEGVVVATGARTVFGRTAAGLARRPPETEFQRGIRRFSAFLMYVVVGMTAFVFVANAALGKGAVDSLLFAVALAVGITPEALPIIVTIALSRGAVRMARERLVTKRLMSVEDLGNMDVLCCDKTGTLTQGDVQLAAAIDPAGAPDPEVLLAGLLCAGPGASQALDRALEASAPARALADTRSGYTVVDRAAFDFQRRRTSAIVDGGGGRRLVVKGSPEAVLAVAALDEGARAAAWRRVTELEEGGQRVLAVADRGIAGVTATPADETGLTLRGFLVFRDPPKPDARAVLARLEALGVELKVMSGDSPVVTRRVCLDVGLPVAEGRVVSGAELATLSDAEFSACAVRYSAFARVTPEQKHRLVRALRAAGRVVGFLGDGVNDAPALKAADVGVSVDSGTDIAKEAADVILLRKDLGVLAAGITEGRKTFGNITKYVLNTVSANFGNMTTVALSSLFLAFIPLLPSQILLANFVSDLPLVALSTDRVDRDLLRRPRHWDVGLIARFMVAFGLLSVLFDLALIVALLRVLRADATLFRTTWFVESVCSEILVTFAIRTRRPLIHSVPGGLLVAASVATFAAAFLLPLTQVGRRYFAFTPLPAGVLLLVTGVLLAYLLAAEVLKRPLNAAFAARWTDAGVTSPGLSRAEPSTRP